MGYKNKKNQREQLVKKDDIEKPSYDVFDNPYALAALNAMSDEEREKYKLIGEYLYDSVDFQKDKDNDNDTPSETGPSVMIEAAACLGTQLRSGLHPSMMDANEKQLMENIHGEHWYTKWGYTTDDLTQMVTLGPIME